MINSGLALGNIARCKIYAILICLLLHSIITVNCYQQRTPQGYSSVNGDQTTQAEDASESEVQVKKTDIDHNSLEFLKPLCHNDQLVFSKEFLGENGMKRLKFCMRRKSKLNVGRKFFDIQLSSNSKSENSVPEYGIARIHAKSDLGNAQFKNNFKRKFWHNWIRFFTPKAFIRRKRKKYDHRLPCNEDRHIEVVCFAIRFDSKNLPLGKNDVHILYKSKTWGKTEIGVDKVQAVFKDGKIQRKVVPEKEAVKAENDEMRRRFNIPIPVINDNSPLLIEYPNPEGVPELTEHPHNDIPLALTQHPHNYNPTTSQGQPEVQPNPLGPEAQTNAQVQPDPQEQPVQEQPPEQSTNTGRSIARHIITQTSEVLFDSNAEAALRGVAQTGLSLPSSGINVDIISKLPFGHTNLGESGHIGTVVVTKYAFEGDGILVTLKLKSENGRASDVVETIRYNGVLPNIKDMLLVHNIHSQMDTRLKIFVLHIEVCVPPTYKALVRRIGEYSLEAEAHSVEAADDKASDVMKFEIKDTHANEIELFKLDSVNLLHDRFPVALSSKYMRLKICKEASDHLGDSSIPSSMTVTVYDSPDPRRYNDHALETQNIKFSSVEENNCRYGYFECAECDSVRIIRVTRGNKHIYSKRIWFKNEYFGTHLLGGTDKWNPLKDLK